MSEEVIQYNPGPVATKMHMDTTSDVKLLIGPVGTGKTTSGAWDLIDFMSDKVKPMFDSASGRMLKKSKFAVIRETYPQLKETTIATYLEWFPERVFGKYNAVEHKYTMRFEDKEIIILFKALDSPGDVSNLMSLDLTGAHIDEARYINQEILLGLQSRLGRYPSMRALKPDEKSDLFSSPPQVIMTTNYPDVTHWLYNMFVEDRKPGYALYQQTQDENRHNLPKNYYEKLTVQYEGRPDLLRTLVLGEWGVTVNGEAVYPEFRRKLHVSDKPIKPVDGLVVRGWDNTGLHPACVITQFSFTGQWVVLKEFSGEDVGITDFAEAVQLWCGKVFGGSTRYRDIGDPAGRNRDSSKMSPAMYLKKMDINIENGIQTFKVRVESVKSRLTKLINGEPAILIDPSCTILISGFEGGYAYPEIGNSGVHRLSPKKDVFADVHDALQYPATRLFISTASKPEAAIKALKNSGMANSGGSWMSS